MSSGPPEDIKASCERVARAAAEAAPAIRALTGGERRSLLRDMASALRERTRLILDANAHDRVAAAGLSEAMRDRLSLDEERIAAMARAIEHIADQPDPLGGVVEGRILPNGIRLERRRVPLGVVLVIYESRPNVTSDAAALCLKSGNAVVLRGGREAAHSNRAIVDALRAPLNWRNMGGALGFVDTPDRGAIDELLRMDKLIDLAIPRGGPALMSAVTAAARVPVVKHDAGNCHVYVDQHLEGLEETAERIVINAKVQRPGVCNAAETLLVHRGVAERMIPRLTDALARSGVEVRGCERTRELAPRARPATEEDWATEYLALTIAVRVVDSLEEACAHIARWGSRHTEAILTASLLSAQRFTELIDSASVMINCSTRFADGGEYGLGAEIGISTSKLHARGPMGAADLTTTQWVLTGSGQIRG
ncbi:MAG: glutamate-5-semialdehyde dehydrogenase [Planctomycetota bacterium]|nr:glutamate-5-semialdehyde dehydrogenase [Planctomycetota bacterium]